MPEGWDRLIRGIEAGADRIHRWGRYPLVVSVISAAFYVVETDGPRLASRVVLLDRVDGRLVERAEAPRG